MNLELRGKEVSAVYYAVERDLIKTRQCLEDAPTEEGRAFWQAQVEVLTSILAKFA